MKDVIVEDMKSAMKAKDKDRLSTIRMILSAIKQVEVDERKVLTDDDIIKILSTMVKQRRESIQQYESGNRPDLAEKEAFEITVIQKYLPQALSPEELDAFVQEAIRESGASSAKDMGKVMGVLRDKVQGRADMGAVSARVKALLAS